ncbi:zinc-binding dehydrogenase [Amycolatopsis sp. NPDC088138]|uniref:zinc-binding dehydrogenase n=1 Tax=Amycolatopsis sp. NPDC088138 TaxID=3363938 RepID=UPI003817C43B
MITTEAWVLRQGPPGPESRPGELELTTIRLPEPTGDQVLVEPLYGSWEANMTHALERSPVDVCRQRREEHVVLGNSGVVRVLRPSPGSALREGQLCLVMGIGDPDPHGYAKTTFAYDMRSSTGLLAKRTYIAPHQLVPIPEDTAFPLERWAPCLRYCTAWDNWRVAYGCWRTQMPDADPAGYLVFGWSGGVSLAQLELARRTGFATAMTVGSQARADLVAAGGTTPVLYDRSAAPSKEKLLKDIRALADGRGVAIFLDHLGGNLHDIVLRVLGRQGVIATCGWKIGMKLNVVRASECIGRHLHVHTHCWRVDDCPRIRDYQEATGWLPDVGPDTIYGFDEIPRLAKEYGQNTIGSYFPVFRINPL